MNLEPAQVWTNPPSPQPMGHLCYVDADAVGFDVRLALPPLCLRCGATANLVTLRRALHLEAGLMTQLAMVVQGTSRRDLRLLPGERIELSLPICEGCLAGQRATARLRWIVRTSPAWWFALVLAVHAVAPTLAGPIAFGLLPVIAALAVWSSVRRSRDLVIERVDTDGIVRLGRVHPDAAQAIQAAASSPVQ